MMRYKMLWVLAASFILSCGTPEKKYEFFNAAQEEFTL